jgi:ribonuclease P protein component
LNHFTFPGALRLSRNIDFIRVLRYGKSVEVPYFVLLFYKNDLPYDRIGISVRKKFGKAVRRNRLKRLVREFFRAYRMQISRKSTIGIHYDLIILPRKKLSLQFEEMEFEEIAKPLRECFERFEKIACRIDDSDNQVLPE